MRLAFILLLFLATNLLNAQTFNAEMIRHDSTYVKLKSVIENKFKKIAPGHFGPFVKGVDEDIVTTKKELALTFDACGGPHGSGYDQELIDFLRAQKIPVTLFMTGLWMDVHPDQVKALAKDSLFEIENHGFTHHPCAIEGETKYGIQGTRSVSEAIDEIELNARKIEFMTSRKPKYYRSATATTDEACAAIANDLGETIISYDLLSGDAVRGTPTNVIKENLILGAKDGAIVIMHMNHPEWNGFEALREALPVLRMKGFTFVKLENHRLKGKR